MLFCPTCGKLLTMRQVWTCSECGPITDPKQAEVRSDGQVDDPFWKQVRSKEAKQRFLKKKYEESLWGRFSSRR